MTKAQEAQLRASEARSALLAAQRGDNPDQAEIDRLAEAVETAEAECRDALREEAETTETPPEDAEVRERLELRDRCRLGRYLSAYIRGAALDGAESEYLAAGAGIAGQIPIDVAGRVPEVRADAATGAPATGSGATLAPIQPYVFAESIAPRLGIEMPVVGSGAYSEATITTALTAGATAKGGPRESTAATLTAVTANPRRVSAKLTLEVEDIASIGQDNFEAACRENLGAALSAEYDNQAINGNGTAPNVNGIINQLADPTNPSAVAAFDDFLAAFSHAIDGLWASMLSEVAIVCNVDAYKLSTRTFRDRVIDSTEQDEVRAGVSLGDRSFADYASEKTAGWSCNARMPATASDIARGIIFRKGRPQLRTACHPVWAHLTIDDIYSDADTGRRHVVMHALVGDRVLLVQPGAYGLAEFKVS